MTNSFLQWRELWISIVQGLVITAGTIGIYQYALTQGYSENLTRAMVFTTLVVANMVLTLVNRSFYYSILTAYKYKNTLLRIVLAVTAVLLAGILYIPFVRSFLKFDFLPLTEFAIAAGTGFVSVIWFELYKLVKRMNNK